MAFDNTVQRGVKLPRIKMECGLLSFTTTSVTIEVPTKFRTKIWCGFGVTQDGTGVSQDAVITAGCVTFTRPSGGTSAAYFNYVLYGY